MAVQYKTVKEVLEMAPLNTNELSAVAAVEKYIDEEIHKHFNGGYVSFNTELIEFRVHPDNLRAYNGFSDIKSSRKVIMTEELKSRFVDAGWEWDLQQGEDDGPNRPAIDYWHLQGK